ncbi:MAG TPA: hypothetical protein VG095_10570 [Chthoniobacterales bacterium]|nr:hypothetical protein [Chthoniobacterales bacterium]
MKERIIGHARTVTAEDHAYTRTVRTETIEPGKTQERVVRERWDPSAPVEQRWKLISVNGREPDAAELTRYRKELPKRRQAHYGRVADYLAKADATRAERDGRTMFRLTRLPNGTVTAGDADLSANATGELLVNNNGGVPFVEEARFTTTKPTRVKLVARIERFEITTRYRMMPDGKPVPVELVSDLRGSMLGREGRVRTHITYVDHRTATK